MEQMLVLLALVVLAVPVLLIICLVKVSGMGHRINALEEEVQKLVKFARVMSAEAAPPNTQAAYSPPSESQKPTLVELMAQAPAPKPPVSPVTQHAPAASPEPARAAPVAASAPPPVTPPPVAPVF